MPDQDPTLPRPPKPKGPFRRAVLRGLGVFLPPLLTIVILMWMVSTVQLYVLHPVEAGARRALAAWHSDIRRGPNLKQEQEIIDGRPYRRAGDDTYVPLDVFSLVKQTDGEENAARMTGDDLYQRYVQLNYLKPHTVIPVFLCVFVLALYLLGKFLAAGLGKFSWDLFERIVGRLPLVRNVYSSVKQVTDFMFSTRELEYTRCVAVEYPRKGTWSLGFVTGESLLDIRAAANEAVLSVLIPTSPMPVTGFTVTVLKSETLDLDLTIDQALEYIVSCGVVVPPHQMVSALAERQALLPAPAENGDGPSGNGDPEKDGAEPEKTPRAATGDEGNPPSV